MTQQRRNYGCWAWLVVGVAWLLTACGGGGDAAPPASSGAQPLVLDAKTLPTAASFASGTGEAVLQIGQLAVDYAGRYRAAGGPATATETCVNGGVLVIALRDRDGNGKASAGDTVTVDLRDCGVPLIGQVLSGTIVIDLTAAATTPTASLRGTIDMGSGVTLSDPSGPISGVTVQLLGTLAFDWSRSDFRTALSVTSTAADDFRLVGKGPARTATEGFRAIALSKQLNFDEVRSVVSLALRYESEVLGGSLTISTPLPLQAYLNTYPDVGRVEVRGAGAAVLSIKPHFVTGSDQFDAELDSDGDGVAESRASYFWADAAQGYLWWDGGNALSWSTRPYATQPFVATGFGYIASNFNSPRIDDTFRLQFTRPPVGTTTLRFRFTDGGSTLGLDPVRIDVAATATHQGALYLIKPAQPLRHARAYTLEASADGVTWGNAISLEDALHNTLKLYALGYFYTPDTLRAVITSNNAVLAGTGASLQLSAADSISALRPIASYRWTQLGGTPLTLSTPQAVTTLISWGATPPVGLEHIVIELTITDTAGEVETQRATVSALSPITTGQVLYFRSTLGDYIGAGQTTLVSDSTGNFSANPPNTGTLSFSYNVPDYSSWWSLNLASADGSPLAVGAYENAIRAAFHDNQNGLDLYGSGRGCNMIVGRFDVLEIAADAQNLISKIAVDFEQHCEGANAPPLFGSLRVNSSLPLRP